MLNPAYSAANQRLQLAENNVLVFVNIIQDAAKKLENWQQVRLRPAHGSSNHCDVTLASLQIDGRTWPTMEELGKAFDEWHEARLAAEAAWADVPARQRAFLKPPTPLPPAT